MAEPLLLSALERYTLETTGDVYIYINKYRYVLIYV